MSGSIIFVDFRNFPDNHQLPSNFIHGGFEFSAKNQASFPVVKDIKNDRGLFFDKSGISISLPKIVDGFHIYAGSDGGPIKIILKDSNDVLIKSAEILKNNKLDRHLITASNISTIELVEGSNEAYLLELIVPLC